MALALSATSCASQAPASGPASFPQTGLVLLSLDGGSVRASATVGSDPVAVAVDADGTTAFLADSAPGDVYAVRLPGLKVLWKRHLGGAPFGLLPLAGTLFVSLFAASSVVELDTASGSVMSTHLVDPEPAVMAVDATGRVAVATRLGKVDWLDGRSAAAASGFGLAMVGGQLWSADYSSSRLVPVGAGAAIALPLAVHPFWLAPGAGGTLLIAAEGSQEDSDPGAVLSFQPAERSFLTLSRPRDPDQVIAVGSRVLVAAHGDHDVLDINSTQVSTWAAGSAPVALAADFPLNLLVVAVNSHE